MIVYNLRGNQQTTDRRLDRLRSDVTSHLDKFPLTAATKPPEFVPVVIGTNWYESFDTPERITLGQGRGGYFIIGRGDLGRNRGGHATCLKPSDRKDVADWWRFYDQGVEGRCVEFAWLRAMSLLFRRRYDITSKWHYHEMQRFDEWEGGSYPGANPFYEGTSVRAGAEIMRTQGAIRARAGGRPYPPGNVGTLVTGQEGIRAYRWAMNWQDVRQVTGTPDWMPGVILLNSWGISYPRQVILADEAGERLMREDGEFAVPTVN